MIWRLSFWQVSRATPLFYSPNTSRLSQSRNAMKHVISLLASLALVTVAVVAEEEPDLDDPVVKARGVEPFAL